jgi:DNA polymerase-3 subunit beta
MKALCSRQDLLDAFGMVSSVVPARSPKPILQSVKLDADPDAGSTLLATDLEVGIRYRVVGVKVDQPGAVILPTQRMQSILRTTPDAEVFVEASADALTVRSLQAEFELPSEDPDLFPDVPDFGALSFHVVSAANLKRLIRRTIFATDVESTRYALGGVLFEFSDGQLAAVGTDGRRLAHATCPAEAEGDATPPQGSPVIPVKALKLLERNLDDQDPPVHIAFQSNTAALIRTERAVIYSRLLEGRFPRYRDVFPASATVRVPFPEVEPLLLAVEQASIVTSDESRGVDFTFGGGKLTLSSKAADVGRSRVELPISYEGEPVEITFDPRYLTEALKTLDPSSPIAAELIDHKSAAVFKTEDGYTYVVMPLTRER